MHTYTHILPQSKYAFSFFDVCFYAHTHSHITHSIRAAIAWRKRNQLRWHLNATTSIRWNSMYSAKFLDADEVDLSTYDAVDMPEKCTFDVLDEASRFSSEYV